MTVHSVSLGVLEVTLDSDLEDTSLLLNRVIFFLNPGMPIPKIDKNGFHIVDGEGNPQSSISKDGIQSLKMNYLDGYTIPENDSSNTISSTEWVQNLLQLEII